MDTMPGGCYKDATGDGYHDAHGNPVAAPVTAAATTPPVVVETVLEKPLQTTETVITKPAAPAVPRRRK